MSSKPGRDQSKRSRLRGGLKALIVKANYYWPPASPSPKIPPRPNIRVNNAAVEPAVPDVAPVSTCASAHLYLPAKKAAAFIICLSAKEEGATRRHMQTIATRLWVLSVALELTTHSAIAAGNIEEEAAAVLLQIRKIFLRREPSNLDYRHIADQILGQIGDFDRKGLELQVSGYFKSSRSVEATGKPSDVQDLNDICRELTRTVTGGWDWTGDLPSGTKVPEPNIYPNAVNEKLFEALAPYTICNQPSCQLHLRDHGEHDPGSYLEQISNRHPTRLPLGGPLKLSCDEESYTTFEIIISSFQDITWTRFQVGVSSRRVRFRDANTVGSESELELEQHNLCPALRELGHSQLLELKYIPGTGLVQSSSLPQPTLSLYQDQGLPLSSAIRMYTFSVRDKILLAHTVAQAFWQLYASDLMRCVWTSDNIWFMHEDNDGIPRNELPMKAYICFDFGQAPEHIPEFLSPSHRRQTHCCPHILALGVLLLEIALGSTVRDSDFTDIAHITRNHTKAHTKLQVLKEIEWDGFKLHMDHLVKAIGHCLDSKKIWQYSGATPASTGSQAASAARGTDGRSDTARNTGSMTDLGARKDLLYDKVVKPLAWLAAAFHEDGEHITYPYKDKTYLIRRSDDERAQIAAKFESKKVLFGSEHSDGDWLDDFRTINNYLLEQVKARKMRIEKFGSKKDYSAIKIAILDTGYNQNLSFFKGEGRESQVKWKDLIDEKPDGVDCDGHGTFMTRLVMTVAPLAEIHVIRVARNNLDLDHKSTTIKQAILYAGLDKDVYADVISMSFAFEAEFEDTKDISDAIEDVIRQRDDKVIFLAAAGNYGASQQEMFPARHKEVISIHAANSRSTFLETDPKPRGSADEFGTIGGDLPAHITREIASTYPKLNMEPGSSIATAVAAGVVANTLIHAGLFPFLDPPPLQFPQVSLQRLRMKAGMERVLKLMVRDGTADDKRRFFNPVWLWKSRQRPPSPVDYNIAISIHDALMTHPFP